MKRLLSYLVLIICVTNLFIYSGCSELEAELDKNQQNGINDSDDTFKAIITDEYIEGFTSVLFSDGNFILIQPDSLEGFYILFDSLDIEKKEPIDEMGISAYCDTLGRPLVIKTGNSLINITNYTSNSFDLTVYYGDSLSDYIEYTNIVYSPIALNYAQTRASTGNDVLGIIGAALSVINPVHGLVTGGGRVFAGAMLEEVISNIIITDNLGGGFTSAAFSAFGLEGGAALGATALGVGGWAVGSMIALRGAAHMAIRNYIGDVTPNILDVSLNSYKQVVVSFDVKGVTDNSLEWPNYSVIYWKQNEGRRYRTAPERITENGTQLKLIEGLSSGRWGFRVIVFPERFNYHPIFANYYSFDTRTLYVTIPPIDIKSVSQEWENTDTDPIQFQFKVIVDYQSDVDKEVIKYNDGYGICVTQNGERTYYPSTENIGTSSPEEYLIPLNVNTTDFEIDPYDNERMRYKGGDIIFQTFFNMDGYTQYGINHKVTPTYNKTSFLSCPDNNHPHMIDLGLSVKWACCNVGASKPEEYGGYYAWGEIDSKMYYKGSNYKYYYQDQFTKYDYRKIVKYNYNNNFETFDNLSKLEPSDDVAHVIMGGNWRMPTRLEMDSLYSWHNCTWIWTTQNGVNGFLVRSKKEGFESASIFLPAAGFRYQSDDYYGEVGDPGYVGERGYYRSSELDLFPYHAYVIEFKEDDVLPIRRARVDGCSVRAVCP